MKNVLGYILGFLMFVVGIPALMWWVSGRPVPWVPALPFAIVAIVLMIPGLALSIWSIVYMKKVGEGNPFDAYNHELAPRTKQRLLVYEKAEFPSISFCPIRRADGGLWLFAHSPGHEGQCTWQNRTVVWFYITVSSGSGDVF